MAVFERKKGLSPSVVNDSRGVPASSTSLQSVLVDPLSAMSIILVVLKKTGVYNEAYPDKDYPLTRPVHPGKW